MVNKLFEGLVTQASLVDMLNSNGSVNTEDKRTSELSQEAIEILRSSGLQSETYAHQLSLVLDSYVTLQRKNTELLEKISQFDEKERDYLERIVDLEKEVINLTTQALTDKLTGVHNRGSFDVLLEQEVKGSLRHKYDVALAILDLDYFKVVNDTYGHQAGDYVLKKFAKVTSSLKKRKTDIFARYGGEEFALILPHSTIENAKEIVEKIRKNTFETDFIYDNQKIDVTVSIGVAGYKHGEGVEDLKKKADDALYVAKKSGRNQVSVAPFK